MKQKRWFKTAICLTVGLVLLTVAVFANYDNANGYSVCKNAVKNFLKENNYSATYQMTLALDGKILGSAGLDYRVSGGGNPISYAKDTSSNLDGTEYECINIRQDGMLISMNTFSNGETYNALQVDYRDKEDDGAFIHEFGDSGEKIINFMEALCDTFVGDLKNSFYLTDSQDGVNTYAIDLKGNQMPEVVTTGVALIMQNFKDSMEGYTHEDESTMVFKSLFSQGEPFIDTVSGTMTVNGDGLPTTGKGVVSILGVGSDAKEHTLTLTLEGTVSEYGTTVIEKVDLSSIPNLIRVGKGNHLLVLDTQATEEEYQAVMEQAEKLKDDGYSVRIEDEDGKLITVMEPETVAAEQEE